MPQSSDNHSESFLLRFIRGTREQVSSIVQDSKENAGLLKRSFEETVCNPLQEAATETKDLWRKSRRDNPGAIVATATLAAMVASIPFGRLAFIRNTILTAAGTFCVTSPETMADILKDTRPRHARPQSSEAYPKN